jgi:tetratricopeptide (TPR) repeat protein
MPPGDAIARRAVAAAAEARRPLWLVKLATLVVGITWIVVGIVRMPRVARTAHAARAVVLAELPAIDAPEHGVPFDPPIAPPGAPLVDPAILGGVAPAEAIARADQLASLAPDDPARALGRALAHLAAGDDDDDALLDAVVRDHPRWAPGWASRAFVRLRAGRFDDAEADFARALDLDPRDATAWRNRGILRHRRGHVRLAYLDLRQAIALAPDDVEALAELVQLYSRLGHAQETRAALERLLALDPTSARARRDLCALDPSSPHC